MIWKKLKDFKSLYEYIIACSDFVNAANANKKKLFWGGKMRNPNKNTQNKVKQTMALPNIIFEIFKTVLTVPLSLLRQ